MDGLGEFVVIDENEGAGDLLEEIALGEDADQPVRVHPRPGRPKWREAAALSRELRPAESPRAEGEKLGADQGSRRAPRREPGSTAVAVSWLGADDDDARAFSASVQHGGGNGQAAGDDDGPDALRLMASSWISSRSPTKRMISLREHSCPRRRGERFHAHGRNHKQVAPDLAGPRAVPAEHLSPRRSPPCWAARPRCVAGGGGVHPAAGTSCWLSREMPRAGRGSGCSSSMTGNPRRRSFSMR